MKYPKTQRPFQLFPKRLAPPKKGRACTSCSASACFIEKYHPIKPNPSPAIEALHDHGSPSLAIAVDTASLPARTSASPTAPLCTHHTADPLTIITSLAPARHLRRRIRYPPGNMGWFIARCAEEEDIAHEEATSTDGGQGLEGRYTFEQMLGVRSIKASTRAVPILRARYVMLLLLQDLRHLWVNHDPDTCFSCTDVRQGEGLGHRQVRATGQAESEDDV